MLLAIFVTLLTSLPISSGIINCRIACRRCREKLEHPDMLEVYCAMCDECKERRREWLEGAPTLLRVEPNQNYFTNHGQYSQDDCPTTPREEPCDDPQLLALNFTTTAATTTTTTTTTTRKPCPPRPCVKPTRPPCIGIACPLPFALPVCPMCPMPTGPWPAVTRGSDPAPEGGPTKLAATSSATRELYFYVGVPKKMLKRLQLAKP